MNVSHGRDVDNMGKWAYSWLKKTEMGIQQRESIEKEARKPETEGLWPSETVHTQDTGAVCRKAQQELFEESISDLWEKELALTFCQAQGANASGADRSVAKSRPSRLYFSIHLNADHWATWLAGKWTVQWAWLQWLKNAKFLLFWNGY